MGRAAVFVLLSFFAVFVHVADASADASAATSPIDMTPSLVALVVFGLSMVLGLLIGAVVLAVYLRRDVAQQQRAASALFGLSFVLMGAAPFSVGLCMRIVRSTTRKSFEGHSAAVFILGISEICCMLGGFLAGFMIELFDDYNENYFSGFIILMGIPTVIGGTLVFGIPRIIVSWYASRRDPNAPDAESSDEEEEDEALRGGSPRIRPPSEVAPLLSQQQQQPQQHQQHQQQYQQHLQYVAPHGAAAPPVAAAPFPPAYFPSYQQPQQRLEYDKSN
jgi:hypothetical protein